MPRFRRFLKICPFLKNHEKSAPRFDPLSGLGKQAYQKVPKWHFCVFFDPFDAYNVKNVKRALRAMSLSGFWA